MPVIVRGTPVPVRADGGSAAGENLCIISTRPSGSQESLPEKPYLHAEPALVGLASPRPWLRTRGICNRRRRTASRRQAAPQSRSRPGPVARELEVFRMTLSVLRVHMNDMLMKRPVGFGSVITTNMVVSRVKDDTNPFESFLVEKLLYRLQITHKAAGQTGCLHGQGDVQTVGFHNKIAVGGYRPVPVLAFVSIESVIILLTQQMWGCSLSGCGRSTLAFGSVSQLPFARLPYSQAGLGSR